MSSLQPFAQFLPRGRPSVSQDSMLDLLPTEIIIQIAELSSRRTLDHLSQACVRMYHIVRPYFYRAENFLQFYNAVKVVNIAMMECCEYFGAAPVNIVWNRPICVIGVARRDTADRAALRDRERDNVFNALGWLLERGANGEVPMANESYNGLHLPSGHMSSRMLMQFQVGTSQRDSEVLFNMIRMLSRYGYSNPTRQDSVGGWSCIETGAWCTGTMRDYHTTSPLDLALKSHVTPSLLNLMLEEYEARGLRLRDWHSKCPPSLVQSATRQTDTDSSISWVEISYIDILVGNLHADLHNETTRWSESYSGEVADIFRAKLDIMIKHKMIDNSERALLSSIGAALYRIAAIGRATGGLSNKHFKMSWEMLWDAVRPFIQDPNLVQDPLTAPGNDGPGRIDRFAIRRGWDPWRRWLLRHDARLHYRKMLAGGTIRSTDIRSRDSYDFDFFIQHMNWDRLHAWYTAGLDEWIALMKNAPGSHSLRAGEDDGL